MVARINYGHSKLRVQTVDLSVVFERRGVPLSALRGVTLDIAGGEILAVVGESGSGKSVLGLTLLGLLQGDPPPRITGRVEVCGVDMIRATPRERSAVRRKHLGVVFQEPMSSLNPTMRVGSQVVEAAGSTQEARRLLDLVGVPNAARRMNAYPHELSGGLCQRVMLAMAVAGGPDLVVADEPTTALDVTVQAQILALIRELRNEVGCSFLLITHDFGVASQVADRVAVLYGGRLMEIGDINSVLTSPSHPYTAGLLRSRLHLDASPDHEIPTLRGEPPDPRYPPSGCPFAPRCPYRISECDDELPPLISSPTHAGVIACIRPDAVSTAGTQSITNVAIQPALKQPASRPVVRCVGITKEFPIRHGPFRRDRLIALRDVAFEVNAQESVAIVGESGSGKSTLLRVIAGLLAPDKGTIELAGGRPQMIFQDAGATLTPWLTVGEIVGERLRKTVGRHQRRQRVEEVLSLVGLPSEVAHAKAGTLSGGQRQRVAFARATILPPSLLLCDEPTSALDASLAVSVLNLLLRLRRQLGMAVVFVTHDLAAARYVADRVAVLYLGEIVEMGPVRDVVASPKHPYTKALLASVPRPGTRPKKLRGEPASPLAIPMGCPFHPRCDESIEGCSRHKPPLITIDSESQRLVSCVHVHPEN